MYILCWFFTVSRYAFIIWLFLKTQASVSVIDTMIVLRDVNKINVDVECRKPGPVFFHVFMLRSTMLERDTAIVYR